MFGQAAAQHMAAQETQEAATTDSADPVRREPIRVLQLITELDRGGAENHLLTLITHADASRFHIEVAVLRDKGELWSEFDAIGVPVHHLNAESRLIDPGAIGRLAALARDGRFDVVH